MQNREGDLKNKRVLYFGIINPDFSRNKIYADGLKANGVEVEYCIDTSRGPIKFWKLFKKHWAIRNSYDAMIVGFPGYIAVPFAKIIAKRGKPVIFDALCSFYETQIISRDAYRGNPFRLVYVRTVDWLATRFADKVLVETEEQKKYFINSLGVNQKKLVVVYTGVDDTKFFSKSTDIKFPDFTVLFRGRITKEAGATYVLEAAKILENTGIKFLIIGFGWGDAIKAFNAKLAELNPSNVKYIKEQVPIDELREMMSKCHISLGQFEDNERLQRTIPHKAFESLSMKIPYITARTLGAGEVFKDMVHCLYCDVASGQDMAEKILKLRDDKILANKIADSAYELYTERFTPAKIVKPILDLIKNK